MPVDHEQDASRTVVIVGMGCVFPGAGSPAELWDLVRRGRDATSDVPGGRWRLDPEAAFDPRIALADHVYSRRGGFVATPELDTDELELDRDDLESLDPLHRLAVHAASAAWRSSSMAGVDRAKVGVILGNVVLPTETAARLTEGLLGGAFDEAFLGRPSNVLSAVEAIDAFPAGLPAAVIARALGLKGPAFTIDAACASSLYAIKLGVDLLRSGEVAAMVCGGVSRPDSLYTQMGFSQLRALSPRGRPAPFDREADGLVVAEGAGVFVLKRLDDALPQGDRILGVIAGIGLSNDATGDLLAPFVPGQLEAMRRAYDEAGWRPDQVDLVECHATGTPRGDAVELESLRALWSAVEPGRRCVISSVKSNIGHALTAAGAAGVIKTLLALEHQTLPPTAHFRIPAQALERGDGRFEVLTEPRPWPVRSPDEPRRAAVSGFGFGGINAHLLIEAWAPSSPRGKVGSTSSRSGVRVRSSAEPVAIVAMSARFGQGRGASDSIARLFDGERSPAPAPPRRWWGIEGTSAAGSAGGLLGLFIDELEIPGDRFRIPPRELEAMLPQQSLMLMLAAEALGDLGWAHDEATRTGVLIGIGLDLATTNYHLRWSMAERAVRWNRTLGLGLGDLELAEWTAALRSAAGPPLSADRTMGSLGGLAASRVAREFRVGGPSFTISSDETSGVRALLTAAAWLRAGELDLAIVGAVDFAGDPRAVLARGGVGARAPVACDAGVCLVLRRLDDARRRGEHVHAVLPAPSATRVPRSTGLVERVRANRFFANESRDLESERHTPHPHKATVIGSIEEDLGHMGAAAGLAAVTRAAASLDLKLIPRSCAVEATAQAIPWLHDRAAGARSSAVVVQGFGGDVCSVELEEYEGPAESARTRLDGARPRPLAALFVLEADDHAGLAALAAELAVLAGEAPGLELDLLARRWHRRHPSDPRRRLATAIVARERAALERLLDHAEHRPGSPLPSSAAETKGALFTTPPEHPTGRLAFVFPGLGNQFPGMGLELALHAPGLVERQERITAFLREQLDPSVWWTGARTLEFPDLITPILGSVAVACMTVDFLGSLGLAPDAAVGYSMGEATALVALGAWPDRDRAFERFRSSPLFATDLAGPKHAARAAWRLEPGELVDWTAGIVPASVEAVRAVIGVNSRVYPLIRNTADETVIGGARDQVMAAARALGAFLHELATVGTVHCPIGLEVQKAYRALHDQETHAPAGVTFYSGVWGRSYDLDRASAASALEAQATGLVDFPAVIEAAYRDGVRDFIEVGPGDSCTRLVKRNLAGRVHFARSVCPSDAGGFGAMLETLAELIARRRCLDLAGLYGGHEEAGSAGRGPASTVRPVRGAVRGEGFRVPPPPRPAPGPRLETCERNDQSIEHARPRIPTVATINNGEYVESREGASLLSSLARAETARAEAHGAFLRTNQGMAELIARQLAFEQRLVRDRLERGSGCERPAVEVRDLEPARDDAVLDRDQCLEFAVGSIAAVLGPDYAPVDAFPTRVRLPDEPLMLVDRVTAIEGRALALESGRVVTEHDVHEGSWYLDQGRAPACIAIEAGQADLLLSAVLGVDFETRGEAVYRLLDATVTFYRALPRPGEVVRYDIAITRFFRQGRTILFRFQFDATIAGLPLLSMRDGCAGFFTSDELEAGRGVVARRQHMAASLRPGVVPYEPMIRLEPCTLDARQVQALREGKLGRAFGAPFDGLAPQDALPLPGGRMTLIHRVVRLEPRGGPHGLGLIVAEADLDPSAWFMTCHFVDDRVMPGTLMYECCLHALRILLTRLGWVGDPSSAAFEPALGVANRLMCRGQVVESTRVVTYQITLKQLTYEPEPHALADALMLADGKPIVEVVDMALRLAGSSAGALESIWARARARSVAHPPPAERSHPFDLPEPVRDGGGAAFDHGRILAFAIGKPSDGFGASYAPFDVDRFVARLPGPPYQFLHRITQVAGRPLELAVGARAEAEYDVPAQAWYFAANRQDAVPFAVLLEAPLQACGWLAAYMGAALQSDQDLKFRNLGGKARIHRALGRDAGTLRSRVEVTKISKTAGMILLEYEFAVTNDQGLVYDGATEFGFFHPRALEDQAGVRGATFVETTARDRAAAASFEDADSRLFPDPRWRMIDRVDALIEGGGPHGLGLIEASGTVDPEAWFFKAHFLGDPVWPGSLGLESMLQALRVAAGVWLGGEARVVESPRVGETHHWTYRGQILPSNRRVRVQAVVTGCDRQRGLLAADGLLAVDGLIIYQMKNFTLGLA